MDVINTFIRIPKKVTAVQWFPSKKLNYVEEILGEVVQASAQTYMGVSYDPTSPYQPPRDKKLMVIGGKVRIGDKVAELEPGDYVIYDIDTGMPIQILAERIFSTNYAATSRFELCPECSKAVQLLNNPSIPQSMEEAIAMLNRGEYINFDNGSRTIKSVEELRAWLAEKRQK
jgi:hypothetical protein